MKREVMEKWVAALRSGEYKQTRGRLCSGKGHCCLGVLEKVQGNNFKRTLNGYSVEGYFGVTHRLSDATRLSAGLGSEVAGSYEGKISVGGKQYDCLAEANDDGRSFAEIADAIERDWERL